MKVGRSPFARVPCVLVLATMSSACLDSFLEPEPSADPVAVFDALWTEFDRHYADFEAKHVDWDEQRNMHRERVSATTPPDQLFQILSDMIGSLQDGHVTLRSPFATFAYSGWRDGYPENFDIDAAFAPLQAGPAWTANHTMAYGRLTEDVGYVYIPRFGPGDWGRRTDEVLAALADVRALVVDVRHNGGGTDLATEEVLARFADRERVYRHYRYRNGPQHDDFTALIEDRMAPAGRHFNGPVALLTNRRTYSAAEDFVLGMRILDNVTVVGATTGGGMGNPIHKELPNGWTVQIPRWQLFDADREPLPDGVGLSPDVSVDVSPEDAEQGRDTIILTGVELLHASGGSR